jgi:hypothetical protein
LGGKEEISRKGAKAQSHEPEASATGNLLLPVADASGSWLCAFAPLREIFFCYGD